MNLKSPSVSTVLPNVVKAPFWAMNSATLPLLTRVPRVDSEGADYDYVLLHISSAGDHPFDLKIIGTENEQAYTLKVKHHKTSEYQAKAFTGNQEQWEEALSAALLGADAVQTDFTNGVEAVAKVDSKGSSITINIQKRIEGITQKLGSITLAKTTKVEPDLFDWCGLAIRANQDAVQQLADLKKKLREKDEETKKLNETLTELVNVKNAHEDDLAQKFSILLNEKKLKIRDQQRLLAAANVDPGKLDEVERNRIPTRSPEPSRSRKRKAGTAKDDDDSEDGFEKMDVDTAEAEDGPEQDPEDRRTEDDETTADDDSEDETPSTQHTNAKGVGSRTTKEANFALPPKRDLPFSKKPPPVFKPAAPVEGSETESDDDNDEL